MHRPIEAIIDFSAARSNLRRAIALARGQRVMAVLKDDAYGHGLLPMARAMSEADAFGVCSLDEASTLRQNGVDNPILLMAGCYNEDELGEAAGLKLSVVVHSEEQLRLLELGSARPPVWLKVDTGMHRLGLPPEDVAAARGRLAALDGLRIECVMTHMADAADPAKDINRQQLHRFQSCLDSLPNGYPTSVANSAALLSMPEASRGDWARLGVILYGASPVEGGIGSDWGFHPVMSLRTKIIATRRLAAGEPVGYGASYTCPKAMTIGIAAIGYGDGYPRHAPSGTPVRVDGVDTGTVGRPSMDMMAVDISPCPEARPGSTVTLWGGDLPVERVAAHIGSIPHALLCSPQSRVPRRLKSDEA